MDSNTTRPHADLLRKVCEVLDDTSGVTAIEYGLLAALIAIACIGAITATGDQLEAMYEYWSSVVAAAL